MELQQNKHAEHPIAIALVVHIALWLLAVGIPYGMGWVNTYGPSYDLHRSILSMVQWGWLFTIGGIFTLLSICFKNIVIKFTARAVASIIIMIWTVLWYAAALQPGFPGYSAIPTYTFITMISILTFYVPSFIRLGGKK